MNLNEEIDISSVVPNSVQSRVFQGATNRFLGQRLRWMVFTLKNGEV